MKKIFSLMFLFVATVVLVACDGEKKNDKVELNVAINYTTANQLYSISYQKDQAYTSTINGKTYEKGQLLPVWETIGEKLNVKFVDKAVASDASTNDQFTRLVAEGFKDVDLVNGTGALIGTAGNDNKSFVDIAKHLDKMPNLSKFLEENESVRSSITTGDKGMYFTPYFDGINELEHMYLARIDWIEAILDAANTNDFSTAAYTVGSSYTPLVSQNKYSVSVKNAAGVARTVAKERTQSPIAVLRAVASPTGKSLADAFRTYLTETYGENKGGYAKWSEVFTGVDATYDTDELVALMYVIKANQSYILKNATGVTEVELYFPREKGGNRVRQMFRGLEMFGLRGVSSRHEWTYVNAENQIKDVRIDDAEKFVTETNRLSSLVQDGLIPNVDSFNTTNLRQELLSGANGKFGFITYDYNASSTTTGLIDEGGKKKDPGMKFEAILPPVYNWLGDSEFFHFSESNRSVKNEAWGIPAHVASNPQKLEKALELVDKLYDYSTADSIGNIHLYGPQGWTSGEVKDGPYANTGVLNFSDKAKAEISDSKVGNGNIVNYLRWYVGASMPIGHVRSLGVEWQTLSDDGNRGIARINKAVELGNLVIAGNTATIPTAHKDNAWFTLVPTFLPFTKAENAQTKSTTFRDSTADNKLLTLMNYGFSSNEQAVITKEAYLAAVNKDRLAWTGAYNAAFERTKAK